MLRTFLVALLFAATSFANADDAARRSLRFPSDRTVGTVYWRMPDGKPFLHAKYDHTWKPIGKTRRTVRVPADSQVRLDVVKAASNDLSWLDDLGPDDIQLLDLSGTDASDEDLRHVARLTGLRALDLRATPVSDAGLESLKRLTNVDEIDLGAFEKGGEGSGVGEGALHVLARLPKLRRLGIWSAKVTDEGLAELAQCRSLTQLELNGTNVSDAGLAAIANCPSLTCLRLDDTKVSDAGLIHPPGLRQLETLWLGENEGVTDNGLKTVGKLLNLTSLNLMGTKITGEALRRLKDLGWLNDGGKEFDLKQLGGKVVLVDFWGTWCGPCRALTPKLKQLHEKYADKGLLMIGVHTTRFADTLPDDVEQESIAWPMAADVDDATVAAWKVPHYPTLFLIDRSGKLRLAGLWRGDLERAIVQLLEEAAR